MAISPDGTLTANYDTDRNLVSLVVDGGAWPRPGAAFPVEAGPTRIVAIGDSITEGYNAGTPDVAWPAQLAARRGGQQTFIPAGSNMAGITYPVTRAGAITLTQEYGIGLRIAQLADVTASVTFTFTGTSARVMYQRGSLGAVMGVKVDGGAVTLVDTSGAFGAQTYDVGVLAPGSHTMTITYDATSVAGRILYLNGLLVTNSDPLVRVINSGHSGHSTVDFTNSTRENALAQAIKAAGGAQVVTILLGTNDDSDGVDPATYGTNIAAMLAAIRAQGMDPAFLLMTPYQSAGRNAARLQAYNDQLTALAAADFRVTHLDLRTVFPAYGTPEAAGLYSDGTHPSPAGYTLLAQLVDANLPQPRWARTGAKTNYVLNPRAKEGTSNWWAAYSNMTLTRTWRTGLQTAVPGVTTAVRLTVATVAGADGFLFTIPFPTGTATAGSVPCAPNDRVSFGMLAWCSWSEGMRAQIQWRTADNAYITNSTSDLQPVPAGDSGPGTWFSFSAIAPKDAAFAFIMVGASTGDRIEAVGDWLQATAGIALVNGEPVVAPTNFWDGETPSDGPIDYAFTGTTDASTSTATWIAEVPDRVTITRSSPGAALVPVRGAEMVTAPGGTLVWSDNEAPMDSDVTYTVTGYDQVTLVGSSSVVVPTTGAKWGVWVKVPGRPELTVLVTGRSVGDQARQTLGGSWQVAAGPAVAQSAGMGALTTALELTTYDPGRLRALLNALEVAPGQVLLIQTGQPEELASGYYQVQSRSTANPTNLRSDFQAMRVTTLQLQESVMPAGPASGWSGASYQDLLTQFETYQDLADSGLSYLQVAKGAWS